MKKVLLAVSLVALTCSLFAQQWYHSTVPYVRNVTSVKILKPGVFIAAGGNAYNDSIQALFRSDDGGLTWKENPTDTISSWIKSIAFKDTLNGFGVGYNSKMVYTTDGGYNWITVDAPLTRHLNKVIYLNNHTLIAVGGEPDTANSLQTVMKSINGGNTWTVQYDHQGQWLRSVYFKDTLNGFAVGDSGVFLQTVNGGNSWTPVSAPLMRDWNDIAFTSNSTGFVVGGTNGIETIIQTSDGGTSWTTLIDGPGARLRSIYFITSSNGKIVGDTSALLHTLDGGQTWQHDTVPNVVNVNFTSVCFYNDTLGIIGAYGGNEFIYTSSALPSAYTAGAFFTDTTNVQLIGLINTYGYTCQYQFIYSTDSSFHHFSLSSTAEIASNTPVQVSLPVFNVHPNTQYYYHLTVSTLVGTVKADTLSFIVTNTNQQFTTNGYVNINDTTAKLLGIVEGFPALSSLSFEYGTSLAYGDSVITTPSIINDTALHNVTATITHLQPLTLYYFRLRGIYNGLYVYGGGFTFYTGTAYNNLVTLPAFNINATSATLAGQISGSELPASLTFEYSADAPIFNQSIAANPSSVNDTSTHFLSANLTSLQPYHNYYYRVKAQTSLGVFYSITSVFFAGTVVTFQLLPPSQIGLDSAFLSGYVNSDTVQTNVWFQYGLNNVFTDSILATPTGIIGNQMHLVTSQLSSLLPNQQYVYRLMAQNAEGTFYSAQADFCTCPNEIPNWDFERWTHYSFPFPSGWYIYGAATQITSYDQSKAVLIQGITGSPIGAALQGFPQGQGTIFGTPFTARPDSMIFYANYNIQTGDTAYAYISFKKNGQVLCSKFYPIAGNSNNNFIRLSLPISYSTGANPDSAGIGFVSTNYSNHPNSLSWLAVDNVSFSGTTQNIPNPDFENWDSLQYDMPERWNHKNEAPINIGSVYPVSKTTDAVSGSYAVKLQNLSLPLGTQQATLFAASQNVQNGPIPGFSVSRRYHTLFGYAKFSPQNNDSALIRISLFQGTHQVATGSLIIDTVISGYTLFSIPITYNDTSRIPDSATITLSPCYNQAHGGSVLYVDDLSFDGLYPMDSTVNDIPIISSGNANLFIYPNPANDLLFIKYPGEVSGEVETEVYNMLGQMVIGQKKIWLDDNTIGQINIQSLSKGSYIIACRLNGITANALFVK